jgi:L-ascorbate metabolism protein UlaG (beta-lactamase superfamily)
MKQFGGKITQAYLDQCSQSPNWQEGAFQNLENTSMSFNWQSVPKLLYKQFFESKGREPDSPLPILELDLDEFLAPADHAKFVWYGHSVVLMRIGNSTILIDPMLGPNASPIAPFKTKRFSADTLNLIDQFPEIDLLLMTHDHYDHLDMDSIRLLMPKVKQYYVAMGVARHLVYWGVDKHLIQEFDWLDQKNQHDIQFTFTPSRHFSGRGLKDRMKSLWGGWVFEHGKEKIYWSGDSGYGSHFKTIGERLGPFDFGFMECGQYNENWHQIHMYPEEAVKATQDAQVRKAMAVHWGGFALAQHTWTDPIDRFETEAKNKNLTTMTPQLGEVFAIHQTKSQQWWKKP